MSEKIKISLVIVNWNGKHFLGPCLDSIFSQASQARQSYEGLEVIVVDNGSIDGSVELLKDNYKEVVLVELPDNIGFAGGNNRGFEIANGDFIFTLNNDTVLKEGFFDELLSSIETSGESVGMWAVKILSMENKSLIDSVGGLLIYKDGLCRGRGRLETDSGQYDNLTEVFIPSACGALYRKEMLDEIGYFDERFFAYCEDSDLGIRARLAGWSALSVPKAVLYHHYSGTAGKYSTFKAYLVERNRIWLVLANFGIIDAFLSIFYTIKRYFYQAYGVFTNKGAASQFKSNISIFTLVYTLLKSYIVAFVYLPFLIVKRFRVLKIIKIDRKKFKKLFKDNSLDVKDLTLKD